VDRPYKRFPRAKLFANAAAMQSDVEHWLGETAIALERAKKMELSDYSIHKLEDRYNALEATRRLTAQSRSILFDCP
jgi:hypothetical protein